MKSQRGKGQGVAFDQAPGIYLNELTGVAALPLCGILISLCQHLYLPQISGFGAKAAEIPWQMRRNRWPVVVPFSWGKEGLVWVEVWVGGRGPSLSVGATVAGQAPPRFGSSLAVRKI